MPAYRRMTSLEELFTAGQWVPSGTYCDIETGRSLVFSCPGFLPPTFDGRVACYERQTPTWGERIQEERDEFTDLDTLLTAFSRYPTEATLKELQPESGLAQTVPEPD